MTTIIRKPYGTQDPYASIELIAHTAVVSDKFTADQMPALAARVSHGNDGKTGDDPEADRKLMNFLTKHNHWSVHEHTNVTFKVVAPLFVIREMQRHRSMNFNEISQRYSSDSVGKMYKPEVWRKQETRNKQGSAGSISNGDQETADNIMEKSYRESIVGYQKLLDLGVCREQARILVPVGNFSEMYMTGNMRSWCHFCNLRVAKDAQWEIRQFANCFDELLLEIYPESWGSIREFFKDKII